LGSIALLMAKPIPRKLLFLSTNLRPILD